MSDSTTIRDHLVRALDWEDARVGFDRAIDGIPPHQRGARAAGCEHTLWQLVEHLRVAQQDILDFCVNAHYSHDMKWPDDYWPKQPGPANDEEWADSIASFVRSRESMKQLARDVPDLTATVPTGTGTQTYLRAILLVIDHAAYHVGQMIYVRRALGIWK